MNELSGRDLQRYDRQIIIKGFGIEGQKKLKNARVAVAGAGGLGSSVSLYLAAAGVGDLTIIDYDVVSISNLNRQILHWEEDIGVSKVESACKKLKNLNPDITIIGVKQQINEKNASGLLEGKDAVVDCMDNFPTRYVLNDAALKLKIPLFHGACYGFEGRAATILPGKTPCFRCIYPQGPPESKIPVLGATPGIVGTIQAIEVIKYITGTGRLLAGRLLICDGGYMSFDTIEVKTNPQCPSCSNL
ncbi:MAG: HesA/MoeB/ThiF family protein [Spirochaetota bacterium]